MSTRRSFIKSIVSALVAIPMAAQLARMAAVEPVIDVSIPLAPSSVLTQEFLDNVYRDLLAMGMSVVKI